MQRTLRPAAATLLFLCLCAGLAAAAPGVVNINTANADQLSLLPRIGPSLAARIIEYRDANGKFKATEELILVRGIGETTFAQLEPYVTVEGETTLAEPVSPSREDSDS